ncbi:MAG: WcaI family glycosyltransferase [Rhodopseudomonas palustris]|uniref:WcaI family glycosyltransferase n=1 Tax=Rhodopseudomonas palustris TaxID=1076 RepID=A0A933RUJ4_RHOPL|nr:WcaI family glycosyltransferase [Rhodopseudomonas palustris]
MKILLVGINYAPDLVGVPKYNTELCEALVDAGHEVRVITAPPYYPAWKVPEEHRALQIRRRSLNGVRVRRVPIYVPSRPGGVNRLLHHLSFALASAIPLFRQALIWRPDVMFAVAPSLMSSALVAVLARHVGARSWLHVQDFEVDAAFNLGLLRAPRLRKTMIAVERKILLAFDRVSSISPQMLNRLSTKGVPADRIRELRNWVDAIGTESQRNSASFRQELGLSEKHFVALYSGTMSHKQGLELIVEAAAALEARLPEVQFVLAGEGPYRETLARIAGGRRNVHFLGLQPNDRFAELLKTANVHLVPQRAEAADLVLPSKLGGIFASGRPVIAMATPGTGLAGEIEGCGVLVPPGDSAALAEAIVDLQQQPELCRRLGESGRKRSLERWDRGGIITQLIGELSNLTKGEAAVAAEAFVQTPPPVAASYDSLNVRRG